jgi:hypothetical protein
MVYRLINVFNGQSSQTSVFVLMSACPRSTADISIEENAGKENAIF